MIKSVTRTGLVALSFVALVGCGSSSSGGGSGGSGVTGSKTLASLNTTEQGQLCDWVNGYEGGYNQNKTCSDGSMASTDMNQAACISSNFPVPTTCAATVTNFENCTRALGADICNPNPNALANADCQVIFGCAFN